MPGIAQTGATTKGSSGGSTQTWVGPPQFRLTTESGVPESTTDRTAQGTVYATPCTPTGAPLGTGYLCTWTGAAQNIQSCGEKSLSLTGLLAKACMVADVFIKNSDLSLTLELWKHSTVTITLASPAVVSWTAHGLSNGDGIVLTTGGSLPVGLTGGVQYYVVNKNTDDFQLATSPGGTAITTSTSQSGTHTAHVTGVGEGNTTQPRQVALALVSNLIVSGVDNTFLWLGTIRATGTDVTADALAFRCVWSAYNQVKRPVRRIETTSSWNYSTDAWQQANASTANEIDLVVGLPQAVEVKIHVTASLPSSGGGADCAVAVGLDSRLAAATGCVRGNGISVSLVAAYVPVTASLVTNVPLGAHRLVWLERADVATTSWEGANGEYYNSGMDGSILN